MKKVIQVTLGFIALMIILAIVITSCGNSGNEPGKGHMQEKPKTQQQAEPPKKEETKPAQETTAPQQTGLSDEKYQQIVQGDALSGKGGSSIAEVVNLLGEPSSQSETQTDVAGQKMKMNVYTWMDSDFKTIIVTFNNDHVTNKSFTK